MRWWLNEGDEWSFDKIIEFVKDFDVVYIGSDSKYFSSCVRYASAIAVYRNPGVTYWYTSKREYNVPGDIRTRIWSEVNDSMSLAWKIQKALPNIKIEVHCDINSDERFASNRFDQQARGYVTGCGFSYINKPYAWCASGCADNHTK